MKSQSPDILKTDFIVYENFVGIDRSKEVVAMENPKQQSFFDIQNGACDWRGALVRNDPVRKVANTGEHRVNVIKFFKSDELVWTETDGDSTALVSQSGAIEYGAYERDDVVTLTSFAGRLFSTSPTKPMYQYNGTSFTQMAHDYGAAFATTASRRLVIAGMPDKPTEILISRVDMPSIFPQEETPDTADAEQAQFIDIRNIVDSNDAVITGVANFERNRLAIFTKDECLIYVTSADYENWQIDPNASIRIGTISHNTIQNVGADLIYCSRHGVHSLQRSEANGLTINTLTTSLKIEKLYQELLAKVSNQTSVSAVYDQDTGDYTITFPHADGINAEKLTLNLRSGYESPLWSRSGLTTSRCGAFSGGRSVIGTISGILEVNNGRSSIATHTTGEDQWSRFYVATPVLWHLDMTEQKQAVNIYLQATGDVNLTIRAHSVDGTLLTEIEVALQGGENDGEFPYSPLNDTYQISFPQIYRGVQFEFIAEGAGKLSIYSIAVKLNKEAK